MKNDRLFADSDVYTEKSDIYELFSTAEDSPKKIITYLKPKLENKTVLDFGCGTGKFTSDIASVAEKYIGTDVYESQLMIAREKSAAFNNTEILLAEKDKLPLKDKSVDVIFCAWVIGGIKDLELRSRILQELKRVLRPGGTIYLVENNKGAEYKHIVDGTYGDKKTELKLEWLKENNFWELKQIETYFEFENTETAQQVFEAIWDSEIADGISKNTVSHNLVILEYTPNIVLDTTKYAVDNAEHVQINQTKLAEFTDSFELQKESNWLMDSPFDIGSLDDEQKLMLATVFNAISFSYWGEPYWNVEYEGTLHTRGSWSLMAAIFRSIEEGKSLLDPAVLSRVTKDELAHILRGNTEIPLLDERKNILNQIGTVLVEKYEGKFSKVIEESNGDALVLIDIVLGTFSPSFNDSYEYKGKTIYFNKRAQALVESIHSIFEGNRYGAFRNIENLTALADYIIPNMLRNAGVLDYSPELVGMIDSKESIEKGSGYEVEIRAGVVWVVELIRRGLLQKGIEVSSKSINDYLWTKGGSVTTPFHCTRTTAY